MPSMIQWLLDRVGYRRVLLVLFHPHFIVPIPSALYHTAGNQVDISLLASESSWG